jgi:hypothetical protein
MKNMRAEWGRLWQDPAISTTGSVTYPPDGRETIYPPYEEIMSTGTVGEYLEALHRIFDERPYPKGVPDDFYLYLRQRVPTWVGLKELPPKTPIDAFGHVG